jgi:hypothetical protein
MSHVSTTCAIENELRDFLADRRALYDIPHIECVTDRIGLSRRISLRKKEILAALRNSWFDANPQLTLDDFSDWLSGHIMSEIK